MKNALVVVTRVLVSACAPTSRPYRPRPAVTQLGADVVEFGSSPAQIRGHHQVGLELYRNGDNNTAELTSDARRARSST